MAPLGITSFFAEGFEVDRFPPAGWTLEFTGHQYWGRYAGASGYGVGTASAVFRCFDAPANTTQSLVLSAMGLSLPGDSLRFDHAYASYSGENDRLSIETSTNAGTTYTTLVVLDGGEYGPLATAPPTTAEFVPTATQWATKRYALPVGTNRVRFRAVSAYGNDLYLDNCTMGTSVAVEVGAQSIDIPNPTLTLPQIPKVTAQNHGTTTQTFTVTLSISPGGYISTRTVTTLASNATSQVSFDGWTPTAGSYNVTAFTSLAGDLDKTNDTIRAAIVANQSQPVTNINAFFRDGQVFVTWTNLTTTNVRYTLYKSSNPILIGQQLSSAQNLGNVRDNSSLNQRLTEITGTPAYLKIDSTSPPLASTKGLFVATSTTAGSFYYAITPTVGGLEDTTIVVGSNSLASPVSETIMMPKPVWQESRIVSGKTFDIYVQFATKVTSSIYPQMTNAGTLPFNFGLVKSGTISPHPVTFWMHPSDGNFLPNSSYLRTIGDSNEWIVTIDDYNPTIDQITGYYGLHEDYDMHFDQNQVPTSGIIYNYTSARVAHTVNWAIRNLPVDSTRTYMTGWSLGAIGALFNSVMIREKIAAIFIYCPRVDMSQWGVLLGLWGTYETNLLTNEGYRRNERLNASFLVSTNRLNALPLMFTFCGKNDAIGWQEKIVFYDSLSANKHGGFHFWSMTDHMQTYYNSPWQPSLPNFSFFTRYRTNLSYPAFTNCSINNNPGNGTPSNGDQIGSINGHLDWNDDIVDTTNRWEITLKLKDLSTIYGSDVAPDSGTTDVTLRRLQAFRIPHGDRIYWENRRSNIVVQRGSLPNDSGLVTIPGVKVYKDSCRLAVWPTTDSLWVTLVAPADNADLKSNSFRFSWNHTAIPAVRYHLQLASDSLFSHLIIDDTTLTDTSYAAVRLDYGTYYWHVCARDANGWGVFSNIRRLTVLDGITADRDVPRQYALQQNCPNPFNPSTIIKFELPRSSDVRLSVFDLLGREVSILVNERRDAGVHEVKFDGSKFASGVYVYRLEAGQFVQSRKLILLR
jgi:hypothetical protein